ncbi:MAG: hypothetical protein LBN39_00175, partial [Planctomycetaceae bacterium]|nr:hypothetical protein [Planctomycetaceae bacterium]
MAKNDKKFREEIKSKLRTTLTKKGDVVKFAWLCAVRALPFLGAKGNFNFWKEEEREEYLYSLLLVLDRSNCFNNNILAVFANAANDAAKTAAYAAYAALDLHAAGRKYDFEKIIFQDIRDIRNHKELNHDRNIYGNVWNNFQTALENIGCGYWGKLYREIFDNGFVLDHEALKRRLSVPEEIRDRGAKAVADYLVELEKSAKKGNKPIFLNEARLIILGEKGAGKTSLARRLIKSNAGMPKEEDSTFGVDVLPWKIPRKDNPDEKINVPIWDFAGHVVTHAAHKIFLAKRCVYVIVYNGRIERDNHLEYWLDQVKEKDSTVFILVNLRGDKNNPQIPKNKLKRLYDKNTIEFYEVDLKKDETKIAEFRSKIIGAINASSTCNDLAIPGYSKTKETLATYFENNERGCIEKNEFDKITKENGSDNPTLLLELFDLLGHCRYDKNIDAKKVFNLKWISDGVYIIFNWISNNHKNSFCHSDWTKIFEDKKEQYPLEKSNFIIQLMKNHELAYSTERGFYIIPSLLEIDEPEDLPEYSVTDSLMMRYESKRPFLPDIISRFIVRHSGDIKKDKNDMVWRSGVILEGKANSEGCTAFVWENDRTINVSVKGTGKTNYLNELRETLNELFKKYEKKPDLEYRVDCDGSREPNGLWLRDKQIYQLAKQDKLYYDEEAQNNVDMKEIVKAYHIKKDNLMDTENMNESIYI